VLPADLSLPSPPPAPGEIEPTEEELLARLGAQLEEQLQGLQAQGCPPHILRAWLREERSRCLQHWLPARRGTDQQEAAEEAAEPGPAGHAAVGYGDISHCLFKLQHAGSLELLVLGCIALLGVQLGGWHTSNQGGPWEERSMSSLQLLQQQFAAGSAGSGTQHFWDALRSCGSSVWFLQSEARRAFLSRMLSELLAGPLAGSAHVCSALLTVEAAEAVPDAEQGDGQQEQQDSTEPASAAGAATASMNLVCADRARALAKGLLAEQRDNLRLWDAYAQLEAAARQHKVARKVYDTALAAAEALPAAGKAYLPVLALHYAELELQRGAADSLQRAQHICFWYLLGDGYKPYSSKRQQQPAPADVARARRAFQERFPVLLATGQGGLDEPSCAAICHAMVCEVLHGVVAGVEGAGVQAAVALAKQVAAAVPADVRRASMHHELLQVRLCRLLLQLHLGGLSSSTAAAGAPGLQLAGASGSASAAALLPARRPPAPAQLRALLLQALELYPSSEQLLAQLMQLEQSTHSLMRLRRHLAAAAQRPGAPRHVWELYLASEALRPGGWVTLQSQLEKAVASSATAAEAAAADGAGAAAAADAGLWRLYITYMQATGNAEAARRVFLRAVRECPWSKALWLAGLAAVAGHLGSKESSELVAIMADKEVLQRTDLVEVMLASLE
jgi:hypothetical protein